MALSNLHLDIATSNCDGVRIELLPHINRRRSFHCVQSGPLAQCGLRWSQRRIEADWTVVRDRSVVLVRRQFGDVQELLCSGLENGRWRTSLSEIVRDRRYLGLGYRRRSRNCGGECLRHCPWNQWAWQGRAPSHRPSASGTDSVGFLVDSE